MGLMRRCTAYSETSKNVRKSAAAPVLREFGKEGWMTSMLAGGMVNSSPELRRAAPDGGVSSISMG